MKYSDVFWLIVLLLCLSAIVLAAHLGHPAVAIEIAKCLPTLVRLVSERGA